MALSEMPEKGTTEGDNVYTLGYPMGLIGEKRNMGKKKNFGPPPEDIDYSGEKWLILKRLNEWRTRINEIVVLVEPTQCGITPDNRRNAQESFAQLKPYIERENHRCQMVREQKKMSSTELYYYKTAISEVRRSTRRIRRNSLPDHTWYYTFVNAQDTLDFWISNLNRRNFDEV